jgi:lysophospholipase L1-like esterase
MKTCAWRSVTSMVLTLVVCGLLAGCGESEDRLENKNPGINDLNVVVAFGDSITEGGECPCVPYPARLSGLIGKVVYNTGIGGSKAGSSVGRTQSVIDRYHPAYMLILYGVNDVIHGRNVSGILGALTQMIYVCRQNNVVPVLATYPVPMAGHQLFAYNTIALNQGIRTIAAAEGIKCVDLELEFAFDSDGATPGFIVTDPNLMERDGLHPNDAGTQVMAMSFADLF